MSEKLCLSAIQELLSYDPVTGLFRWKRRPPPCRRLEGTIAGTPNPDGYITIRIFKKHYRAHRLAWLFTHGVWPLEEIDHIDGDPANNAISNLREATRLQNCQNVKGRGYYFSNKDQVFRAQIMISGRWIYLGSYEDADSARAAYVEANRKYRGEFSAIHREGA